MNSVRYTNVFKTIGIVVCVFACTLVFACLKPCIANAKAIYLGDSRTALMAVHIGAVKGTSSSYIANKSVDTTVEDGNRIVARGGKGFGWLRDVALPRATKLLQPGDSVVILVGINSLPRSGVSQSRIAAKAAKFYNLVKSYKSGTAGNLTTAQAQLWKAAKVYFATVTMVNDKMVIEQGGKAKNLSVNMYNACLKTLLDSDPDISLIDLNAYFSSSAVGLKPTKATGFRDGMHYNQDVSVKMYGFLNQQTQTGHWHSAFSSKGWHKVSGKRYLADANGQPLFGWQKVGKKWYWLGYRGVTKKGWITVVGKRYYLKSNGARATKTWLTKKGKTYRFSKKGIMLKGWVKVKGKRYYLGTNGVKVCNKWMTIKGKRYYFDAKGVAVYGLLSSAEK